MASLIKKGRKGGAAEEATSSQEMVAVGGTADPEAPTNAGFVYSPPTPPLPNMPRSYGSMSGYDQGATYSPPSGAGDFQLPQRYMPAAPPPSRDPDTGTGGLLQRVLMFSGETSAAERDRVAAEEFAQAIAPVMEYMRANQPDASTPEEAARLWAENQGSITPDPQGGSFVAGDAFDHDARIYYRLLRRDYERYPRPSERGQRKQSPYLHQVYGKLTGNKGW